ncbi:hypothetical protein [Streptomyces sp. NEAU-YJ-81]|uniref:hypothetical protein n=1 Tax=Streptomyces sp. NEAU-YJ-81 TaxID=2820288 RepID=UPI001ABC75D4|nr:hypothetical protein [Streptomyces sp. NEAU-YJ-81]MBO3682542.1 hypothetical protein [Streptomyces sp. NEAU-YJ-81]
MIKKLHDMGLRSEHAYTTAVASIGLSIFSWTASLRAEQGTGLARADRWGIFIGEWAPTFFGLGLALSHYEQEEGSLMGKAHTNGERQRQMADTA